MGELVHTAKIRLVQKKRPFRDAHIEGFAEPLHFGMHGGYAKYYGVKDAAPLPTTVDHVISALAGWLTGTLAGALEARGIPAADNLETEVEGRIEGDDKFFRIAAVSLRYKLKIPKGKRPEADRALAYHEDHCPVHVSIKKGFEVSWSADVEEI